MASPVPHYQVAIAGGGVAGLTLALIFEKLKINYVLLEARHTLEPGSGAGIGLQPNGMRILDQLGLLEEVENCTIPLSTWYSMEANGDLISDSSAMGQYLARIGYSVSFIERRQLIRIMASHLKEKDCVHTSSRVVSINETQDHVEIQTANGHHVTAELLLGSDGVNSCVRDFISRSDKTNQSPHVTNDISCAFSTVYGMSSPTDGIEPGERFAVYQEKKCLIGFTGKDVVFWFVFSELDQRYPLAEIPRFTEDESVALCESVAHLKVTPDLKFGDLYANKIASFMVPVEEGLASQWHTARTAILGDAACKMTPAGGQGANQAMESCVVLVNELRKAQRQDQESKMSHQTLERVLERYAQQRQSTAKVQLQRSQMVLEALFCMPGQFFNFRKILANISDEDWLKRAFSALADAPTLDEFELSDRGHQYNAACQAAVAEMRAAQQPQSAANGGLKAPVGQRATAKVA